MVSLNPMTEASAGSGGSRDLIMLQMLAPTSDIVFLNTSPQAPVEIANSAMMQPIGNRFGANQLPPQGGPQMRRV